MELNPDFQEFLRSFVAHDVRFLIAGGMQVPFLSVDDFRTNKIATGRFQHQADAAHLRPGGEAGF